MRTDQRLKINNFRASLIEAKRYARERKYKEEIVSAIKDMNRTLTSIGEKKPESNVIEQPDMTPIADSIRELKTFMSDRPSPIVNVKAPIVNVTPVLVNEDIYARYKRANSSTEDSVTYHGFVDANGNWFIQLESGTEKLARSRYAVGKGNFVQQWPKRSNLDYKLLNEVSIP